MSQVKCCKCGEEAQGRLLRFIIIDVTHSYTKNYSGLTTTTTQTVKECMMGVTRKRFCDKCISKIHTAFIIKTLLINLALFICAGIISVLLYFALHDEYSNYVRFIWIPAMPIVSFPWLIPALGTKPLILVGRSMKKSVHCFIPADSSIYVEHGSNKPSLRVFKKQTGLKTNVADIIFEKFIKDGKGNQIVDSIMEQGMTHSEYKADPANSTVYFKYKN